MADSRISLVLLSLLLAAAAPPCRAIPISGTIAQVRVSGRLFCTVNGNPLPSVVNPALVGANVRITCNNEQITLGEALTDLSGLAEVVYATTDAVLFDSSTCIVRVTAANVLGCTVLPPTRVLGATIVLLNLINDPLSRLTTAVFGFSPFFIIA